MIIASYIGYSIKPPQDEAMIATVKVWEGALDEAAVPSNEFQSMLSKCLAGRGSNFPPGVSEICETWRKHLASLPRQTIQEQDAVKAKALPEGNKGLFERGRHLYGEMSKRLRDGRGNVQCDCAWPARISADFFDWECDGKEKRCDFRWAVADTYNAPIGKGKVGPMGSDYKEPAAVTVAASFEPEIEWQPTTEEMVNVLVDRCGMDLDSVGLDQAQDFAVFMSSVATPDLWTLGIVKSQWKVWKAKERKE